MAATEPQGAVLIVDDDEPFRVALTSVLVDEGYPVATAAHGQAALAYLRANAPPRLILLNLVMPVMNGWVFRAEQQQDPALAAIPVVLVSGVPDVEEQAGLMLAAGCLQKPVTIHQVLEAISACNGHR
jgi:CheY-like chemotaxis protein